MRFALCSVPASQEGVNGSENCFFSSSESNRWKSWNRSRDLQVPLLQVVLCKISRHSGTWLRLFCLFPSSPAYFFVPAACKLKTIDLQKLPAQRTVLMEMRDPIGMKDADRRSHPTQPTSI